jgi:Protein of unknown function (DUF3592)
VAYVIAILVALSPFIGLVSAWAMARESYILAKAGARTQGTVTCVYRGRHHVVVQYAVDGHIYRTATDWACISSKVGDAVRVVYRRGAPQLGCVDDWRSLWWPPVFLFVLSVIWGVCLYIVVPLQN